MRCRGLLKVWQGGFVVACDFGWNVAVKACKVIFQGSCDHVIK